jgi:hypothetical protein
VGSLQITANTDGQVFVDGRDRGRLPLIRPIRLRGPRHFVRIAKEGYTPFERVVDVAPGSLLAVSAELRLLTGVGVLRVEDSGGRGERDGASSTHIEATDVFIDGRRVGSVPWEGVVEPGRRLVWTRRGSQGSAPVAIVVVQGQTALARMASSELGPKVRIEVSPPTAEISLDGMPLGSRSWEGRLPVGMHHVTVAEAGYTAESKTLMEPPEPSSSLHLRFALVLDPGHARWNRRVESPAFLRGRAFLGSFGGYMGSATLRREERSDCSSACVGDSRLQGFFVGLRSGYRFAVGLAPELVGGYMAFGSELTALRGLFIGTAMSYRALPTSFLGVVLRTTVGVVSAETEAGTVRVPTQPFFVMPEIGAEAAFGGLRLGVQLGLGFFPSGGPVLVQENMAEAQARPYGSFLLWAPQLGAAYSFE